MAHGPAEARSQAQKAPLGSSWFHGDSRPTRTKPTGAPCATGQPHATKAACTPAEPAKEPTRSPAHVWANPTRYTEADRNSIGLGTRNPPSFLAPVTRCALPGPQPIAPHGSPSPPRDCSVVRSVRDI